MCVTCFAKRKKLNMWKICAVKISVTISILAGFQQIYRWKCFRQTFCRVSLFITSMRMIHVIFSYQIVYGPIDSHGTYLVRHQP